MTVIPYLLLGFGLFALFIALLAYVITTQKNHLISFCVAIVVVLAIYFYWREIRLHEFNLQGVLLLSTLVYIQVRSISSLISHYLKVGKNSSDSNESFIVLISKAVLPLNKVLWVEVNGKYCEFYLLDKTHPEVDRISLKQLISKLPNGDFWQINRSTLVNRNLIEMVDGSELVMRNGQTFTISPSYHEIH